MSIVSRIEAVKGALPYTFRKVKMCEGHDGIGLSADIYKDEDLIATVFDDARGGCIELRFCPTAAEQKHTKKMSISDAAEYYIPNVRAREEAFNEFAKQWLLKYGETSDEFDTEKDEYIDRPYKEEDFADGYGEHPGHFASDVCGHVAILTDLKKQAARRVLAVMHLDKKREDGYSPGSAPYFPGRSEEAFKNRDPDSIVLNPLLKELEEAHAI